MTPTAYLQRDGDTRRPWLHFSRAPAESTRRLLRRCGWAWVARFGAWTHADPQAVPPAGIVYALGRNCDYSRFPTSFELAARKRLWLARARRAA